MRGAHRAAAMAVAVAARAAATRVVVARAAQAAAARWCEDLVSRYKIALLEGRFFPETNSPFWRVAHPETDPLYLPVRGC